MVADRKRSRHRLCWHYQWAEMEATHHGSREVNKNDLTAGDPLLDQLGIHHAEPQRFFRRTYYNDQDIMSRESLIRPQFLKPTGQFPLLHISFLISS
jgi:hypothetical protein